MFSKLAKTTVKTLRFYDESGLLCPAKVDEWTGYRYYTTDQLFRLNEIVALRQSGFSLSEISDLFNGRDMDAIFKAKKTELQRDLRAAQERLNRLSDYINKQQEGIIMSYTAAVKTVPECLVYSYKTILPTFNSLFELMPELGERLSKLYPDLRCAEPDYCFSIYPDLEFKEKDINVELCQAVTEKYPDSGDITFKTLPEIRVVSVLHKGSYATLAQAYAFALNWIKDNGYSISGEPRESYIDGIWNKENEEDWLTEIQIPI
jgi:DNA-binding transcriptional MerR regulator